MRRLTEPPSETPPDLSLLAPLRRILQPGEVQMAGGAPYSVPGDVVSWHYGASLDLLRVVQDDARGLVAWLPAGSERVTAAARDGRGLRERSLEERAQLAVARDYDPVVVPWRGPGLVRIAAVDPHPWPHLTSWSGTTVLKLRRQGEWYSVWRFLTPPAASSGGTRTSRSPSSSPDVEVNDLQLDLVVDPDGSWHWKDVEALAPALASGRIDDAQPHHVLETVASVPDLLERDERWWSPWDDWTSSA